MMKKEPEERVMALQPLGFCPWCGCRAFYSPYPVGADVGWDSELCLVCDVFLESACGCELCSNRPERPSDVKLRRIIYGIPSPSFGWPPPKSRRRMEQEAREDEEELG